MNRETIAPLIESLIRSLVPSASGDPLISSHLRNWAIREIRNDTQGSHRREWQDVHKSIDGLVYTAKVRVQDDLAEALGKVKGDLARRVGKGEWNGDAGVGGIDMSNLPQHIQFLLNLSNPPTSQTHNFAESYLSRQSLVIGPTADQILYEEIMNPPFRGDHWGQGWAEEVQEGWSESDPDSGVSTSSDDEIYTPSSVRIAKIVKGQKRDVSDREEEEEMRLRDAAALLERMGERAYWRMPGVEIGVMEDGVYGWKALSTETSSLVLSESLNQTSGTKTRVKLISSEQLLREMLFALTGRPNFFFTFQHEEPYCAIIPDHPQTPHYSKSALCAILTRLFLPASNLVQLRTFIQPSPTPTNKKPTQTTDAFTEAIRSFLQDFGTWVADLETYLIQGVDTSSAQPPIGTPLALLHVLESTHSSLISLLTSALPHTAHPVQLTNTLYTLYTSSLLTCTPSTSQRLLTVFVATSEPLWASLSRWLHHGIPIPSALTDPEGSEELDDEREFCGDFWVKRDKDVSWADEDFWECAWVVEKGEWPVWLDEEEREKVVEAGKARGLLRGLRGGEGGEGGKGDEKGGWKNVAEILVPTLGGHDSEGSQAIVDIASTLQRNIDPICDLTLFSMRHALIEELGLLAHLDAVEGTMYHTSFGVMDEWREWLFVQVDSNKKSWADFQTLSSTYRETIHSQGEIWMNAPAIRLSLSKRLKDEKGGEALGLIRVDYQVPFPLSQLFSPTSMELRSDVFTFLLQLGYGRHLLHSVRSGLLRGLGRSKKGIEISGDMSRILALKQRLVWIIDTIWVWIHDRVINPETTRFREKLGMTTSLGEMIQLELAHTRIIRKYCFLHDSTSIINGCVHDLLNLAQSLVNVFQFAQAEMIPPPPPLPTTRTRVEPISHVTGRSRRRQHNRHTAMRRKRPNTPSTNTDTSDSEVGVDDDDDVGAEAEAEDTYLANESETMMPVSFTVRQRLEKLEMRLREVVLVFQEGVEELVFGDMGSGLEEREERAIWGMLAFALEDWR